MQCVVNVTPQPRFAPGERTPGTHCTGGWMGPRAGLDTEDRGKNPLPLPGIESRWCGRPVPSQTLSCLSYPVPVCIIHLPKNTCVTDIQQICRPMSRRNVWHSCFVSGRSWVKISTRRPTNSPRFFALFLSHSLIWRDKLVL
jgi:hypothetical protein